MWGADRGCVVFVLRCRCLGARSGPAVGGAGGTVAVADPDPNGSAAHGDDGINASGHQHSTGAKKPKDEPGATTSGTGPTRLGAGATAFVTDAARPGTAATTLVTATPVPDVAASGS